MSSRLVGDFYFIGGKDMVIVYPNQKIVTVHKAPANKENVYGVLNKAAAFSALQNLTHNELKVFMYLALNQPDYCMALSTSDIAAKVGSTEDGMRKAVQGLIKKGYMVQEQGRAYAFYENLETGLTESEKTNGAKVIAQPQETSQSTDVKSIVYESENRGEIIKKNILKNTVDYMKEDLSASDSSEWDEVFQRIKVKCFPHTLRKLEETAGCFPDVKVIRRIISQNWSAFEKGLGEQEGYRFKTLLNLVEDQYRKWEHVIAMDEAEYLHTIEKARIEPRINYDMIHRADPREPEGLGDISGLLDEFF